ncbi:helix-turn-helix domain-containing protein [Thalassovita mediterranea]|nr:helix-turn-helix domain-containing protein [Thalassovita mediterranea]
MSYALFSVRRKDLPHARIYDHYLEHASWRELSPFAFKAIVMLMASYRPDQANVFPVGESRMAETIGCAPATAKNAIDELIEGGFLKLEQKGRNRGKASGRERIVSLTQYDTETSVGDPSLPVKTWQRKQKSAHLKSVV